MKKCFIWVVLFALPKNSTAQYFNKLYNMDDSTRDVAFNIMPDDSNNLFIHGYDINDKHTTGSYIAMHNFRGILKGDGTSFNYIDSTPPPNIFNPYYTNGRLKKNNNSYVVATTIKRSMGILKYSLDGTLQQVKTDYFSDTDQYIYFATDISAAPNGNGYFIIGVRRLWSYPSGNYYDYNMGQLLRIDSNLNYLWSYIYPRPSGANNRRGSYFWTIDTLPNNKLIIGASDAFKEYRSRGIFGQTVAETNRPWYITMDTSGQILTEHYDSSSKFVGGGNLVKDKLGGYYLYTRYDTVYGWDPVVSWPYMVAHLDSNFNTEWSKNLYSYYNDSVYSGRDISVARQMKDGSLLMVGTGGDKDWFNNIQRGGGWLSKITRTGQTVFSTAYMYNGGWHSAQEGLVDARECANGDIVAVGMGSDSIAAIYAQNKQDVWVLRVDNMGGGIKHVDLHNVGIGGVAPPQAAQPVFSIYPNPNTGHFYLKTEEKGSLELYDLLGKIIFFQKITQNITELQLPIAPPQGLYLARFKDEKTGGVGTVKLILNEE